MNVKKSLMRTSILTLILMIGSPICTETKYGAACAEGAVVPAIVMGILTLLFRYFARLIQKNINNARTWPKVYAETENVFLHHAPGSSSKYKVIWTFLDPDGNKRTFESIESGERESQNIYWDPETDSYDYADRRSKYLMFLILFYLFTAFCFLFFVSFLLIGVMPGSCCVWPDC